MQMPSVGAFPVRLLTAALQDVAGELFTPGRVLQAEVVSVFQGRAVLAFGRGVRVEVRLQAPLQEGQRITVQVQPRTAETGRAEAPILLKLVDAGSGATPAQSGQQTMPVPAQVWLPIPLPEGRRGWAQLVVEEEPEEPRRGQSGAAPLHRVRIWWETPHLGAVQVSLEAAESGLAALFTARQDEARRRIEEGLSDLQARLAAAGFPDARLGARRPLPGEGVEPYRTGGAARLDRRM